MENPFEILGLTENASEKEIEKAYKKLSTRLHPDKGGNPYLFNKITDARNYLLKKEELIPLNQSLIDNNYYSLFDDLIDDFFDNNNNNNNNNFYSESYNYSNVNGDVRENKLINNNGMVTLFTGDGSGKLIKK